jgi:hypothetical protein
LENLITGLNATKTVIPDTDGTFSLFLISNPVEFYFVDTNYQNNDPFLNTTYSPNSMIIKLRRLVSDNQISIIDTNVTTNISI